MSYSFGKNIKVTVFGQSHAQAIGVVIDGLPYGYELNQEKINCLLDRRRGKSELSTTRREKDEVNYLSGIFDGKTCGAPLCAVIYNEDTKSKDYSKLKDIPRPSHADFTANQKYGNYDYRGGGQFSGRLTAPLCIAGAIAKDLLEEKGIFVKSRIKSILDICDEKLDLSKVTVKDFDGLDEYFPVIDQSAKQGMLNAILTAKSQGDSVGGKIECFVFGMPIGVGEPNFDGLESVISSLVFAVPAVKGIEFGNGFDATTIYGSQNNDGFYFDGTTVKTYTNNAGGINGGISNGMPIAFTVGIKPTPSIFKEQDSVNLSEQQNEKLLIQGRHDPCITPRACAVIESVTALAVLDLLIEMEKRKCN